VGPVPTRLSHPRARANEADITVSDQRQITAEAYLARLAERGIDYVFANAGTDFAPIIEAISRNTGTSRKIPKFVTVPHENVAMGMAHGYYRASGKPAAVMVHVTVGTANTINGLMNAVRDNVPLLLAAGRTPLTETGHIGSRNRSIHWGQEAFDQGGMVREFVKWDYELRGGQPVEPLVDRALDIAMSEPRGPVYMTLPREVLAEPAVAPRRTGHRPLGASPAAPARGAIEEAAALIAKAEFPLIVTSSGGRTPEAFAALAALAEEFALPVVQSEARDINIPTSHPMHLGFDVGTLLPKADVVVVLEAPVPWVPRAVTPRRDATIIHIAADPLETKYPFREFETDLLITGEATVTLPVLHEALRAAVKRAGNGIDARRKALAAAREDMEVKRRKLVESVRHQTPIHLAYLAACVNELKAEDAIVINELGLPVGLLNLTTPRSYFGGQLAGGLGFGLGAALGAKLASPEREVIAAVGDGSYMFGNPLPFHFVGRAENLPTLTIINNNQVWHAVKRATLDVYPDGRAAKANVMPLTDLKPAPDYEKVIATCGGHGEKVESPADLMPALKRALAAVRSGTPALLNVLTQGRN
jgi:acetolactate synthase-1/2/3 large subunit